jgi:superfamily II DNA helicase RecQ
MNDEIDDAALLAFLDKVDPIPVSPTPSLGVLGGNVQKCMVPNDANEVDDAALMEFLDRVDPIPFSPSASINTLNENSRTVAALPSSHLSRTLNKHFGFTSFRPGQETAVSDILRGRDVGVFWSTGSGKSLCYLLPALESGQISIVISPLISLMQDQCIAFNNTVGKGRTLAVYLGSSQTDPDIEQAAFQGTYLVIFMTPEKLESSRRSLEVLHASRRIGECSMHAHF